MWLEQFRKLWEKRFEQLDELLLTMSKKKNEAQLTIRLFSSTNKITP